MSGHNCKGASVVEVESGEKLHPNCLRSRLRPVRIASQKMDPLSIIASIAGVSTAGISLSRAIYDAISSVRNAPKEVSGIARGLSDLSITLRELQRVLNKGKDVYRRKLIRRVASAVKRMGRVQREIKELLDGTGSLPQLKWIFRKSKTMELLYAIESHKTGISLILQTMMLAIQLKQISR